jgi:hypothetical protein
LVEPVAPTPSYSAARQGPHQPSNGLGVPDPDASQGSNGPLGPLVERSIQHPDGEPAATHVAEEDPAVAGTRAVEVGLRASGGWVKGGEEAAAMMGPKRGTELLPQ